jgi:hypothetical protein
MDMSRVIQHEQYAALLKMRNRISANVMAGNDLATHTAVGMLQGYLIGLCDAGEIDAASAASLENDMLSGIGFLVNAQKAGHAH